VLSIRPRTAFNNLKAVIEEAGFSLRDVVSISVFMADLNEFPERTPEAIKPDTVEVRDAQLFIAALAPRS
jgi:enamine deaminase RidA (YjgF/YER057c/UK114 family)